MTPDQSGDHEVPAGDRHVRLATYNLRYASAEDGPNSWPMRRSAMIEQLRGLAVDVLATQEGELEQLEQLTAALGYARIGQGRLGGSEGEHTAILYDPARIEVTNGGDLWLSHTPSEPGSVYPGARLPRMLTWAHLRCGRGSALVINSHLSHVSTAARAHGARLIRDLARPFIDTLPVLALGDFNAAVGSPPFRILTEDGNLTDALALADEREGDDLATFTAFGAARPGARIDWILVNERVRVHRWWAVVPCRGRRPPSDHLPVVVDVSLDADLRGSEFGELD